jgi:hypothetical protein
MPTSFSCLSTTSTSAVQGFEVETPAATELELASFLGIPLRNAIVGAGTLHGRKDVPWDTVQ